MGVLSSFIAREFPGSGREREVERAGAAIPAIPASRGQEASKNSGNSRGAIPNSAALAHRCACGAVGIHGVGWFLRQPDRATWYCSQCFTTLRAAGRA